MSQFEKEERGGLVGYVFDSICPSCGKRNDAVTGMGHDEAPEEGSLIVCIGCGTLTTFRFTDDGATLHMVPVPEDEYQALPLQTREEIEYARLLIHRMQSEGTGA